MIVAGIVAHNEERLISTAIRSVLAYVDRVVVLEARFDTNEEETRDRQRWEVGQLHDPDRPILQVHEEEPMTEVEARNALIGFCTAKDLLLVIDADERLVGDHGSIGEMLAWARSGNIGTALGIGVYTSALLFNGDAPQISEEQYGRLPVVWTVGVQPRLFLVKGSQYRLKPGDSTPALYQNGVAVGSGTLVTEAMILNDRVRKDYGSYQNAWRWEQR